MTDKYTDLLILLSIFSVKLDLNNKAFLYISKAQHIDSNNEMVLELKSFILMRSGRYEECREFLRERVKFESNNINYIRAILSIDQNKDASKEFILKYLKPEILSESGKIE